MQQWSDNPRVISEVLDADRGRRVSALVPPGAAEAIVFAADGGWHLQRLGQALEDAGIVSTMVVGVDGPDDDDDRLAEYVQGFDQPRFLANESFFVDEVRRWAAERLGIGLPADRTAVWGASLGAEFALAMGLRHPDIYGTVFALSPGAGFRPPEVWPDELPHVYLAAGTQEPFFLENAERWGVALRASGTPSVLERRVGGHGDRFWFDEFPAMVSWAFESSRPR